MILIYQLVMAKKYCHLLFILRSNLKCLTCFDLWFILLVGVGCFLHDRLLIPSVILFKVYLFIYCCGEIFNCVQFKNIFFHYNGGFQMILK